jgi:hypothetical protein
LFFLFFNKLLLGAVYLLGPQDERAEVERDVRNMSELGFNLLTLWPTANSWLAPDTGDFVFDDTLHFLDVRQSQGMKVIMQLTGQNPAQEFAPDCLIEDAHLIRSSPHNIYIDYNHPEVRAMVLRYFDVSVGAESRLPCETPGFRHALANPGPSHRRLCQGKHGLALGETRVPHQYPLTFGFLERGTGVPPVCVGVLLGSDGYGASK